MFVPGLFLFLLIHQCTSSGPPNENPAQIFTSTFKLTHLLDSEMESVKLMRGYIAHQRQMIANMKEAQNNMDEMIPHPELYYRGIDHPINAYRLVNRFMAHWKKVYNTVFNTSVQINHRHQIRSMLHGFMPQPADFHGSYKSLLRLQLTYKLSPKKMVDGLVLGQMSDPMDQVDCYNMALTAIQLRNCAAALEWIRLAGDKAESEQERLEIHHDVDDFKERLKSQDPKVLSDVIQQYIAEAIGYDYEGNMEEDEDEEEIVYQTPDGHIIPPDAVNPNNNMDGKDMDDDLDVSEIASEDFVEGELNVAQFSSEMEQDLEAMDQYEYLTKLQQDQTKLEDSVANVEDVADSDPLHKAVPQAQMDLQNDEQRQPKCSGGGGGPRVIKERTIQFEDLAGSLGGMSIKIRYQGQGMDDSELDEIETMAEEMVIDRPDSDQTNDFTYRYHALCRGEEVRTRDISVLKCRYRHQNLPYNVWKEEFLSREPAVSVIYDFVTDAEINELMEISKYQLGRAMAGRTYIEARIQSTAWHPDNTSASIMNLSKRVSAVTGLDALEGAEKWQVGQYGLAGHYAPHYDYSKERFSTEAVEGQRVLGDRMATFMMYLSDVEAGGYTVFPELGIHAKPIRGAAVFWYNYSMDGTEDDRTLHGGCPVLMGHKWVANKWIHLFGNEFNRKCGRTKAVTDCDVHNC